MICRAFCRYLRFHSAKNRELLIALSVKYNFFKIPFFSRSPKRRTFTVQNHSRKASSVVDYIIDYMRTKKKELVSFLKHIHCIMKDQNLWDYQRYCLQFPYETIITYDGCFPFPCSYCSLSLAISSSFFFFLDRTFFVYFKSYKLTHIFLACLQTGGYLHKIMPNWTCCWL